MRALESVVRKEIPCYLQEENVYKWSTMAIVSRVCQCFLVTDAENDRIVCYAAYKTELGLFKEDILAKKMPSSLLDRVELFLQKVHAVMETDAIKALFTNAQKRVS